MNRRRYSIDKGKGIGKYVWDGFTFYNSEIESIDSGKDSVVKRQVVFVGAKEDGLRIGLNKHILNITHWLNKTAYIREAGGDNNKLSSSFYPYENPHIIQSSPPNQNWNPQEIIKASLGNKLQIITQPIYYNNKHVSIGLFFFFFE